MSPPTPNSKRACLTKRAFLCRRGAIAGDAAFVAAAHGEYVPPAYLPHSCDTHVLLRISWEATRAWSLLSQKWFAIELGRDSEQALRAKFIVDNPKLHRGWGTKSPVVVGGP